MDFPYQPDAEALQIELGDGWLDDDTQNEALLATARQRAQPPQTRTQDEGASDEPSYVLPSLPQPRSSGDSVMRQASSSHHRELHYEDAEGIPTQLSDGRYTRFTVTDETGEVRKEITYFDSSRKPEPFATASQWDVTRYDAEGHLQERTSGIVRTADGKWYAPEEDGEEWEGYDEGGEGGNE